MSPGSHRVRADVQRVILFGILFAATFAALPAESPAQFSGSWNQLTVPGTPAPSGRKAAAAAYDSQRHRLIVFGGYPKYPNDVGTADQYFDDVWALDLATNLWTQLAPTGTPPAPRTGASAIYDSSHDRLIVFGGGNGGSQYNQVWQLSLAGTPVWTLLTPSGTPPAPRSYHMAVFDAERQRMILFGGYSYNGTSFGDTWELSLSGAPAWSAMSFAISPSARFRAGMAMDPGRDRLILYGGWGGINRSDTWTLSLEGTPQWTPITTTHLPPGRSEVSLAYDAANDRMVSFGGNNGQPQSDTWILLLSGAGAPDWMNAASSDPPSPRYGHSSIYDPVAERVVIFGGFTAPNSGWGEHSRQSWALNDGPNAWTLLNDPGELPSLRARNHTVVRDPIANRFISFGGERPQGPQGWLSNQLHSFDTVTNQWVPISAQGPSPTPRYAHRAVWDHIRDRMLVFGGWDSAYLGELWEYRRRPIPAWTQLFTNGAQPAGRMAHGMVFDVARDRLVIFGGTEGQSGVLVPMGDVWTLPLSGPGAMTWHLESPTGTPPSPRWGHVMVMDGDRDRALVFGGEEYSTETTNDLFALDLASDPPAWSLLESAAPPPPTRQLHAGVIDPERDWLVIFGGFTADPPSRFLNDTWIYPLSGPLGGWHEKPQSFPLPSARNAVAAIDDPVAHRTFISGGYDTSYPGDNWYLTWDTITNEVPITVPTAHRLELAGSWPNPVTSDRFAIAFSLSRKGDARLELMDIAGRRVLRRDLAALDPGQHRISFEAGGLQPGVYIVRLEAEGRAFTARTMIIR
jgi:hypothetical protein